jgi:hypothetical protein
MLIDSRPAALGAGTGVAVVYGDGSVQMVSIDSDSSQQPEVTRVFAAPDQGDADIAATAVDAASSRLAVILQCADGATVAHIHSLQVRQRLLSDGANGAHVTCSKASVNKAFGMLRAAVGGWQ